MSRPDIAHLPEPADAAPAGPPARRVPVGALVRFAILVVLVAAGFAVLRWTPLAGMLNERTL
ncbi:MAG TPA: hypothetical protein VIH93_03820, partial [Thermoanaerobaculia bacterium]